MKYAVCKHIIIYFYIVLGAYIVINHWGPETRVGKPPFIQKPCTKGR